MPTLNGARSWLKAMRLCWTCLRLVAEAACDCGSVSTSLTTESPSTAKLRAQSVPAFVPASLSVEIDLERGLAAIDLGIEADEPESGAGVAAIPRG